MRTACVYDSLAQEVDSTLCVGRLHPVLHTRCNRSQGVKNHKCLLRIVAGTFTLLLPHLECVMRIGQKFRMFYLVSHAWFHMSEKT